MTHIHRLDGPMRRNTHIILHTGKRKHKMTSALTAPVDAKSLSNRLQIVNPPVTRVIAHSDEDFLVCAHGSHSVTCDTTCQENPRLAKTPCAPIATPLD